MKWQPATVSEVAEIVRKQLARCSEAEQELFRRYGVEPYAAAITRHGNTEKVVVVAVRSGEAMYWEDVEEGFNISPLSPDERIAEHWCNDDELSLALRRWLAVEN